MIDEARIRIDSYLEGSSLATMVEDVREGLSRSFKELPPKYFYDERGSELFERITTLPEYYPTRCERWILNRHAGEIVAATQAAELVELGSGSGSKTRALLYAMAAAGTLRRYVPVDVSRAPVAECAQQLVDIFPGLEVHGLIGDFEHHLRHLPPGEARLVVFLGGTIGNLYPKPRVAFLRHLRGLLGRGDHLLLGADLVKDVTILEAAYNDSQGVTAEFNRNVLRAVNRELGADFEPDAFTHVAFFDADSSWIEMRLRAEAAQDVRIERAGLELALAPGEEIRTEISTKFTRAGLEVELAAAGFELVRCFTDPDQWFGLFLARANGA